MQIDRTVQAGDWVAVGRTFVQVSHELAATMQSGDQLLAVATTSQLCRIPANVAVLVSDAVEVAQRSFAELSQVSDEQITSFFETAAQLLSDDGVFSRILTANASDVSDAIKRGRSTTRLELSDSMRRDMIDSLRMWRDMEPSRDKQLSEVVHDGWLVEERKAPLGVLGFVFEGRPNVFADATGVLRSGNTVVFRIGSDALGTAKQLMALVVAPALQKSGLPIGAVVLIDSPEHAAGWALFSDARLSLAVARGSGEAVAQLGAIAQQSGVPVSLHGTGGAWMIVGDADESRLRLVIENSLDRKVCNTLNVICVTRQNALEQIPILVRAALDAAKKRNTLPVVHGVDDAEVILRNAFAEIDTCVVSADTASLGIEYEWENAPEFAVVLVDDIEDATQLFNRYSPQFIVSVVSRSTDDVKKVWEMCNAPFVGDGFTRWVDGQFALLRPELGLSNWQQGRLFARPGVLSGDSAYSVRLRVQQFNDNLHR
ncbi:MAG: aldehyde dehydrogenase family protein [Actinobacteria bacterium]|nr:aldehyde dehydrogenase family protein [Actinomycetota bacterium]